MTPAAPKAPIDPRMRAALDHIARAIAKKVIADLEAENENAAGHDSRGVQIDDDDSTIERTGTGGIIP